VTLLTPYTGDDVTAIVPSVDDPGRAMLCMEAVASIGRQTIKPHARLVSHEKPEWTGVALAKNRNRLITRAETEWVALLDDDDLWYPSHLATLLDGANQHMMTQIVYSWGDGRAQSVRLHFDAELIRQRNIFTSTILLRKSAWEAVGGYPEDGKVEYEDWALNLAVLDKFGPAAFVCMPVVTFDYRWVPTVKSLTGAWRG
jgi:hypothetical protein